MCGIAGYAGAAPEPGEHVLARMVAALRSRGPDGDGALVLGGLGLAHTRLSVVGRTDGPQPLRSPDGRYLLVFDGELENWRDLRARLEDRGHRFAGHTDIEVVLAAWQQWGLSAFNRFKGAFALAVGDLESGTVVLARDLFGIRPLHYAQTTTGRVVFASAPAALLASGAVPRGTDGTAVYRYLRFGVHDDTERTFFGGVRRLLPGHFAVLEPAGRVRTAEYTSVPETLRGLSGGSGAYDGIARSALLRTLNASLRRGLVSDVPVGVMLSGGLGSATLAALVDRLMGDSDEHARYLGRRQEAYSVLLPGADPASCRRVDGFARGGGASRVHRFRPSPEEFRADIDAFVRAMEEPVASPSSYAQYRAVREAAAAEVRVVLTGQGAGALLPGAPQYRLLHLRDLQRQRRYGRAVSALAASALPLGRAAGGALAGRVSHGIGVSARPLLAGDFAAEHSGERVRVVDESLKRRIADDIFRGRLQPALRCLDRTSARFSVAARSPFLSVDLLRVLWGVDGGALFHGSADQWALRDSAEGLVPAAGRAPFPRPRGEPLKWIREPMREVFASETFASRPFIDHKAVRSAFRGHLNGRPLADPTVFWRLFNLELWMRAYVDSPYTGRRRLVGAE
ncbi:asparagine synthase (glutamine-hydrolysing) [Murinocardiopsis flavida]|uniref:asparagine synthase (glutamine-hydrolyzing) n=1 Tax=Murinocardiopsis flavida TaxID=645275 RepID=A0A2P8CUY2_9ACTN|nr:asparagine synthetase B [Murinocardiopsis flavida]PSK88781.1 asparagine synthase (glutamine-hydrolysing) [Murinocardiopsis flavida]